MISEDGDKAIASLYKATYGILFFGTPHKGLVVADIQKMIAEDDHHPRATLLEDINKNSSLLLSQLPRFKNVIRDRKVVSFYEQSQTRSLVKVSISNVNTYKYILMLTYRQDEDTQSWSRSGVYTTSVDADSAVLELPDSTETKIPLDSDHSRMVKFDSKHSEAYKSALYYISEFVKDAPAVVAARFCKLPN